jgi:tetratricopeptide (TPR) repeat protein
MSHADLLKARYDRLRKAMDSGHTSLTIVRAREILEHDPDFGPVWQFLGNALIELARYDEAEYALSEAIRLCPPERMRIPLAGMGHLFADRGDYPRAAEWYRKAIESAPDHAGGYIHLGGTLAREGRLDEAEMVHRAATRCKDGCLDEAHLNLGLVLLAQERFVEAAECFERALELDPDYREAKKALRDVRRTIAFLREDA